MSIIQQNLGVTSPSGTTFGNAQALYELLASAGLKGTVNVNYATGICIDQSGYIGTPASVSQLLRGGQAWADYGTYPFVQCGSGLISGLNTITRPAQGFAAFMSASGLSSAIKNYPTGTQTSGHLDFPLVGATPPSDAYDFDLADWQWGHEVGYPYGWGFVTSTNLSGRSDAKVPSASLAPWVAAPLGSGTVYVYSMVAFRVGNGWYFIAQPQISAQTYATFIEQVLSGGTTTNSQRQAALSSTPKGSTPAQASAAGCLPSSTVAKYGATNNGYVAAVQNALRQKGYSLGTTGPAGNGVDGDFGPLTLTALNKWQGSKGVLNQNFGCGKVIVDKQMGPAVYKALGITAPASVGGSSAPPPASSGGSGGSGGGSKKGTTGHTVNPTGTWSGSGSTAKAYASVDGKNVLEKVPLAGGTLTIDGVVVTWGQAPGYSSGGGIFAGIFDDLAKALNTTPQNVELGAAGVVLLGVTLAVTQGGGKR